MKELKQLAGQTAVYGVSSFAGRLLNYFLVPFYTRVFNPGEYGVVTEMYAYISFLMILFTYGMETAYFRFSSDAENKDKVYSTSLITLVASSVFLALLFYVLAPFFASAIRHENHPEYIQWFAIILAADAVTSIPFARLRQQMKAARFAVLKLLNIFVNVGLNIFFLVICPWMMNSSSDILKQAADFFYDPSIGVGYVFIANLASSVITMIFLLPEMKIKWEFDRALWMKMIPYALPLLPAGLAGMVNETLDRILVKYLVPDEATAMAQLGIYGACYKIAILMTLFIQAFRFAAEPFFFAQANKENAKQIYAKTMNYFVIICAFIFLAVMLYIDLVQYFVGENFREGMNVVPVLLIANMCLGIYYNLSIWYKLQGKTQAGAWIALYGALITLVLNFWWIPLYGYTGAAWATLICYASMMILSWFLGQKYYPVAYNLKKISGYIFLALGIYLTSAYLPFSGKASLAVNTLLMIVFTGIVLMTENRKAGKN